FLRVLHDPRSTTHNSLYQAAPDRTGCSDVSVQYPVSFFPLPVKMFEATPVSRSCFLLEIPYFEISLRLSLLVFLRDIRPLVIELLSFRKTNLYFHKASAEID